MFDPLLLVFWPGAIAVGAFVALPVVAGIQAVGRRFARRRNSAWHCGRCNAPLAHDDLRGDVFVANGLHVCSACADVYKRRYRFALIAVPVVATLAAITTTIGIAMSGVSASWWMNSRLIPVLLPSVGFASAFAWRLRA